MGGWFAILGVTSIMIILIAVLAIVIIGALAHGPWGVFSIAMTIPIALLMGVYMRFIRPGAVGETSAIGIVLLVAAIAGGSWVSHHPSLAEVFTLTRWIGPSRSRSRRLTQRFTTRSGVLFGLWWGREDWSCMDSPAR